jgi:hypothetical protein
MDTDREAAARHILERLRQRAELDKGIGILQVLNLCGQQQARADLAAEHGRSGQDREARRVIADIEAGADGQADPDARWD